MNSPSTASFHVLARQVRAIGLLDRRPGYYRVKITVTIVAFFAAWVLFVMVGNSWATLAVAPLVGMMFTCPGAGDPYWLALTETPDPMLRDLHFHIGDAQFGSQGFDVFTTNSPIVVDSSTNNGWWHIAAVFDKPFTNLTVLDTQRPTRSTITTNAVRLYLNGVCIRDQLHHALPVCGHGPGLQPGRGHRRAQPLRFHSALPRAD